MRVVAYIRVSTSEQCDGYGLEIQEESVKDYCQKHKLDLVHIFSDVESGTVVDRPGLTQALEMVQGGDALLVYHTDRISRRLKHLLHIIDVLCKQGKQIISTTQPEFDLNNPMGRLILSILGAVGEFELSRITERMVAGRQMARKRAEGTDINPGLRPAYHQRSVWEIQKDGSIIKRLVKDETALETINLIKRHRRSGKSYYRIAQWLNDQGISNKSGKPWNSGIIKAICLRKS